jgi:hypothetical protein
MFSCCHPILRGLLADNETYKIQFPIGGNMIKNLTKKLELKKTTMINLDQESQEQIVGGNFSRDPRYCPAPSKPWSNCNLCGN